jgi:hypothetical protein
MAFAWVSINPLPAILSPIRAKLAVILAAFWSADPDRVIAAFDHLLIALLHPVGAIVAAVLAPLPSSRLGKTQERSDERSRQGQELRQKTVARYAR